MTYLITIDQPMRTEGINHGQVELTEENYLGDTPVEDYGKFAMSPTPFPAIVTDDLSRFFIALMFAIEEDNELYEDDDYPNELLDWVKEYEQSARDPVPA